MKINPLINFLHRQLLSAASAGAAFCQISVVTALAMLTVSCSDNEPEPPVVDTTRTVLVYMVAANDLGSVGLDTDDIEEMRQAAREGHFGKSRLLVYHAPYSGDAQLKEVLADGTVTALKTYPFGTASVSVERMRQVIADTKSAAPALDYGMVLWSHSSGWIVDGIEDNPSAKGMCYSYGQDRGRTMNVASLRRAIGDAGLSFVYFDCCLMGGVEVMYELRRAVDKAVVSAAEVALPGMPYHLSLRYLMSPEADLVKAAETTYRYYESFTSLYDRSCTISVIDLTALEALAAATRGIYATSPVPVPEGYEKKSYTERDTYYFDFADYIDALAAGDVAARRAWHDAFDRVVVYKAATRYFQSVVDLSHHSGLSTYIFTSADGASARGYDTTGWYSDVASALL